jgi:uncharacterized SAM-binding protein YcdF (DUF218 family)
MKWHGVAVALGSPNDDEGNLSLISRERLSAAADLVKNDRSLALILTGGFGPQFNTTSRPHADYAREYVLWKGVPDSQILALVESSYTIEDATLTKPVIDDAGLSCLIVVTSDYHLNRARLIFDTVFKGYERSFIGVQTQLPKADLIALTSHEQNAIVRDERFLEQLINENNLPCPMP